MLGQLYERALDGERCWIRHRDGGLRILPVHWWLGAGGADNAFDDAVVALCSAPTIELGCGPGRLVARLIRRGVPTLGVDRSATTIRLAGRCGALALLGGVFQPLPGMGCWQTVLLIEGNVGLGGSWAALRSCWAAAGAVWPSSTPMRSVSAPTGYGWSPLDKSVRGFRWASVGLDSAAMLARQAGLSMTGVHLISEPLSPVWRCRECRFWAASCCSAPSYSAKRLCVSTFAV
jgi:hypothetical protein